VRVSDRSVKAFFTILLMVSAAAVSFGAVSNPVSAEKHSTTLTCDVSPQEVHLGLNVTISGGITPYIEVPVTLTFIRPDGTSLQRSTWTEVTGWGSYYSYTFTPDMEGVWRVHASWPGNDEYYGDTTDMVNFTVLPPIILTRIYITLSRTELAVGETLEISGRLVAIVNGSETPLGGMPVILEFDTPAELGYSEYKSAITRSDGTFSIEYKPSTFGEWGVRAYWDGTENYAPYSTGWYSFTAHERKFPIVEAAVGGVVAVVIVVVALKFRRRGRS